ncbi:hypothetical protein BGX38DRAFT_1222641 [Terfezia claveryi]|nr:hypothetical protein BGX38DRAFT_1222641 [Terfezia claveryi]
MKGGMKPIYTLLVGTFRTVSANLHFSQLTHRQSRLTQVTESETRQYQSYFGGTEIKHNWRCALAPPTSYFGTQKLELFASVILIDILRPRQAYRCGSGLRPRALASSLVSFTVLGRLCAHSEKYKGASSWLQQLPFSASGLST